MKKIHEFFRLKIRIDNPEVLVTIRVVDVRGQVAWSIKYNTIPGYWFIPTLFVVGIDVFSVLHDPGKRL